MRVAMDEATVAAGEDFYVAGLDKKLKIQTKYKTFIHVNNLYVFTTTTCKLFLKFEGISNMNWGSRWIFLFLNKRQCIKVVWISHVTLVILLKLFVYNIVDPWTIWGLGGITPCIFKNPHITFNSLPPKNLTTVDLEALLEI